MINHFPVGVLESICQVPFRNTLLFKDDVGVIGKKVCLLTIEYTPLIHFFFSYVVTQIRY